MDARAGESMYSYEKVFERALVVCYFSICTVD